MAMGINSISTGMTLLGLSMSNGIADKGLSDAVKVLSASTPSTAINNAQKSVATLINSSILASKEETAQSESTPATKTAQEYFAMFDAVKDRLRHATDWSEAGQAYLDVTKAVEDYKSTSQFASMKQITKSIVADYAAAGRDLGPFNTEISQRDLEIMDGFESRIEALTAKLGQVAQVSGNIVEKQQDGTFDWGSFQILDLKTGSVLIDSADGPLSAFRG